MNQFEVVNIRHDGAENKGFHLIRKNGVGQYLFLHFKTPVEFLLCNKKYTVAPDMCILMPPCTPHEILASSCTLVHNWVHFHISDFSLYKKLGLPENTFFSVSDSNAITSVFRQCENDMILRKTMWQENCSCLLESCFISLKRELQETEHTAVLGKSVLHFENFSNLRMEIYRNCGDNWSIDKMSSSLHMSRSRFSVLYKNFFNISPMEDVINAKTERAKYLLQAGKLPIEEIAWMCGYSNVYHFIRQFKIKTGFTPSVYRSK